MKTSDKIRSDIYKIVVELADKYSHEVNDEMGDTWCRFCDATGPDRQYTPPVHHEDCILIKAKKIRNSKTLRDLRS